MSLVNVTETLVRMVLDKDFIERELSCACEKCVADVMALTLNQLPARYVSTDQGLAYVKAQYFNPQIQSDIFKELAIAANLVGTKPHHA